MLISPRSPKTKILATLGPLSSNPAMLRKLYLSGLNAVRLMNQIVKHTEATRPA